MELELYNNLTPVGSDVITSNTPCITSNKNIPDFQLECLSIIYFNI